MQPFRKARSDHFALVHHDHLATGLESPFAFLAMDNRRDRMLIDCLIYNTSRSGDISKPGPSPFEGGLLFPA
jgi:hypothetical protein